MVHRRRICADGPFRVAHIIHGTSGSGFPRPRRTGVRPAGNREPAVSSPDPRHHLHRRRRPRRSAGRPARGYPSPTALMGPIPERTQVARFGTGELFIYGLRRRQRTPDPGRVHHRRRGTEPISARPRHGCLSGNRYRPAGESGHIPHLGQPNGPAPAGISVQGRLFPNHDRRRPGDQVLEGGGLFRLRRLRQRHAGRRPLDHKFDRRRCNPWQGTVQPAGTTDIAFGSDKLSLVGHRAGRKPGISRTRQDGDTVHRCHGGSCIGGGRSYPTFHGNRGIGVPWSSDAVRMAQGINHSGRTGFIVDPGLDRPHRHDLFGGGLPDPCRVPVSRRKPPAG